MNKDGKKFEQDFKSSVPTEWDLNRFNDGTSAWDGNTNARFQKSNVCDFLIFNGYTENYIETKSYTGKSLPISGLRENQIIGLTEKAKLRNVFSWIVVNFRDLQKTYALRIEYVNYFIDNYSIARKSIPICFFENHGILIPQELKRTRYTYDLRSFIK